MFVLMIMVITVAALYLMNRKALHDTKTLASDAELDKLTENLPNNEEICKEQQQLLGSTCKIELDDNAKSSAYIYFLNKIILSNTYSSQTNYSRVLFITHECVHSIQDKTMHLINFIMANIKNIFDIFLFVLIILHRGSLEMIFMSFFISFLSFYFRIILETDAVYRSVIYARKFLEKRDLGNVADKYEEIVPKTISGMYFSYVLPLLLRHFVMMALLMFLT